MKAIVITGASSGIGLATAEVLIKAGYQVFGSVRNQDDARQLMNQLGSGFHALQFDVTDEPAVQAAAQEVRQALKGETLTGLVNNAGICLTGPLLHTPAAEMRRQLDVNLTGQLIVTQAFAPHLGADRQLKGKPGRVIYIGSVLGKITSPYVGPYCASKYALEALTDTLRMELEIYGISVSMIRPGPISGPMFEEAANHLSAFEKTDYGPMVARAQAIYNQIHQGALPPECVARVVLRAISDRRPRASYVITDSPLMGYVIPLLMPKSVSHKKIAKAFGLTPPTIQ